METMKQSGLRSSPDIHDSLVVMYFLYWWNQKFWKFDLTLKVKVNRPPHNKDFKQVILHLWSKFGDPLGMSYGADKLKIG